MAVMLRLTVLVFTPSFIRWARQRSMSSGEMVAIGMFRSLLKETFRRLIVAVAVF